MAIRPKELLLMKVGMINPFDRSITLPPDVTKNNKRSVLHVPGWLMLRLVQMTDGHGVEEYVFTRDRRRDAHWKMVPGYERIPRSILSRRFMMVREKAGLGEDVKLYGFKHSGAVSMVENGINILDLKNHLRHTNLAVTERYVRKYKPTDGYVDKFIKPI